MILKLMLFALLMAVSLSGVSAEYRVYFDIKNTAYSEPIAIKSIMERWQTPFVGGDKAFVYSKAEVGVGYGGWRLGILERLDYQLRFSSETAELAYVLENRLPLDVGKEYALNIKVEHNYSRGVRLAYKRRLNSGMHVGLAVSYLQNRAFTDGYIKGSVQGLSEKEYLFQFDVDYLYSHDVLFGRKLRLPQGQGYSLDFSVGWIPTQKIKTHLDVVDLLGEMFWNKAPYTLATASSDTKSVDEEGYTLYDPAVSGFEFNKSFSQKLPPKIFFSLQYDLSKEMDLLAEIHDFGIVSFTQIGAEWCYKFDDCFQSLYNTTAQALHVRYRGHGIKVELASDQLQLNRSRYLSFNASFSLFF